MRKLFLLTVILLFAVSLSAQSSRQKELYNGTLSTTAGETITTATWSATEIFGEEGRNFKGRFDLVLNVTNTGPTTSLDRIYVLPFYHVGNNWVEGDTITWNTNTQDDVFSATKTKILPQTDDSASVFLYKMDPTEESITGMGWDEMYWELVSENLATCKAVMFLLPY